MTWTTWRAFFIVEAIMCLSPGPAVIFVVSRRIAHGLGTSLWATLGILAGNTAYFVLVAAGLATLLEASPDAFLVLKTAGAVYLIYLGATTIWTACTANTSTIDPRAIRPGWHTLLRGFALQTSNPKAIVFFAAFLPQFIDPAGSIAAQVGILGVTSLLTELGVLAGYGYLAGRAGGIMNTTWRSATECVCGAILIIAGIWMFVY